MFTWQGFFDILPIVIRGQFRKTVRQLTRPSPWSIQICSSQPVRFITQVIDTGSPVLEDIPIRVDGKLQFVFLDGTSDWVAIKSDEYRRGPAEKYCRRVAFQAINVFGNDLALVQVDEYTVQRNDPVLVRNGAFQFSNNLACLIFRERLKVDLDYLYR